MAYSQEEINKLYQRQRKQIYKKIRRLESRGYIVSKDILPKSLTEIKKEGKEPTIEDVEHLRQVKTKEIYEKTYYEARDLDTGQIKTLSYEERRKQERSESAKKGAETKRKNKKIWEAGPVPPEPPEENDIIIEKILYYIYYLETFVSTAKSPSVNQKNTNNVRTSAQILEEAIMAELQKNKTDLIRRIIDNSLWLSTMLSRPYTFYDEPPENQVLADILTIIKSDSVSFDDIKKYAEETGSNFDVLSEEDYDDLPF